MKFIKRIVSATTAIALAISFSVASYAHTDSSNIQHDAANNKWDIYEVGHSRTTHSSGNGIYVICDSSLTSVNSYSTTWNNYVDTAISAQTSASFNGSNVFKGKLIRKADTYSLTNDDIKNQKTLVKIYAIRDADARYWAETMFKFDEAIYYSKTSSGAHIQYIRIKLNLAKLDDRTVKNRKYTLIHELGHVIGLADLSSDFSDSTYSDCLMGYENYSTLAPQPSDIKGAAVIAGYYTSHTMSVCDQYINSEGKVDPKYHKMSCPTCDGYVTAAHTWRSGKCRQCGYVQ